MQFKNLNNPRRNYSAFYILLKNKVLSGELLARSGFEIFDAFVFAFYNYLNEIRKYGLKSVN